MNKLVMSIWWHQYYALSMQSLLFWYQIWQQIILKREKARLSSINIKLQGKCFEQVFCLWFKSLSSNKTNKQANIFIIHLKGQFKLQQPVTDRLVMSVWWYQHQVMRRTCPTGFFAHDSQWPRKVAFDRINHARFICSYHDTMGWHKI